MADLGAEGEVDPWKWGGLFLAKGHMPGAERTRQATI
jgi:hypothetical protein